jgi:hypothetical protein
MTFDINEARAIIEDAKKRGVIKAENSATDAGPAASSKPVSETSHAVIPDWLQEGIRQGPLVRPDTGRD